MNTRKYYYSVRYYVDGADTPINAITKGYSITDIRSRYARAEMVRRIDAKHYRGLVKVAQMNGTINLE